MLIGRRQPVKPKSSKKTRASTKNVSRSSITYSKPTTSRVSYRTNTDSTFSRTHHVDISPFVFPPGVEIHHFCKCKRPVAFAETLMKTVSLYGENESYNDVLSVCECGKPIDRGQNRDPTIVTSAEQNRDPTIVTSVEQSDTNSVCTCSESGHVEQMHLQGNLRRSSVLFHSEDVISGSRVGNSPALRYSPDDFTVSESIYAGRMGCWPKKHRKRKPKVKTRRTRAPNEKFHNRAQKSSHQKRYLVARQKQDKLKGNTDQYAMKPKTIRTCMGAPDNDNSNHQDQPLSEIDSLTSVSDLSDCVGLVTSDIEDGRSSSNATPCRTCGSNSGKSFCVCAHHPESESEDRKADKKIRDKNIPETLQAPYFNRGCCQSGPYSYQPRYYFPAAHHGHHVPIAAHKSNEHYGFHHVMNPLAHPHFHPSLKSNFTQTHHLETLSDSSVQPPAGKESPQKVNDGSHNGGNSQSVHDDHDQQTHYGLSSPFHGWTEPQLNESNQEITNDSNIQLAHSTSFQQSQTCNPEEVSDQKHIISKANPENVGFSKDDISPLIQQEIVTPQQRDQQDPQISGIQKQNMPEKNQALASYEEACQGMTKTSVSQSQSHNECSVASQGNNEVNDVSGPDTIHNRNDVPGQETIHNNLTFNSNTTSRKQSITSKRNSLSLSSSSVIEFSAPFLDTSSPPSSTSTLAGNGEEVSEVRTFCRFCGNKTPETISADGLCAYCLDYQEQCRTITPNDRNDQDNRSDFSSPDFLLNRSEIENNGVALVVTVDDNNPFDSRISSPICPKSFLKFKSTPSPLVSIREKPLSCSSRSSIGYHSNMTSPSNVEGISLNSRSQLQSLSEDCPKNMVINTEIQCMAVTGEVMYGDPYSKMMLDRDTIVKEVAG